MAGMQSGAGRSLRWRLTALVATGLLLGGCGQAAQPSPGGEPTTLTGPTVTSMTAPIPTTTPTPTTTSSATTSTTSTTTATKAPTTLPPGGATTPAGAVGVWLSTQGHSYAGDCAGTTIEDDVYKYCSTLCVDRADRKVYAVGPTFSEYTKWLLVERRDGTWFVVDTAKLEGSEPAPW